MSKTSIQPLRTRLAGLGAILGMSVLALGFGPAPAQQTAPEVLGNRRYKLVGAAPGEYVLEK